MKIIPLLFLLSVSLFTHAQTTVPGGTVSGNWTLSGSPYLVQGSIQIASGSTLTIAPGVKVEFQGTYKLLVLGQLMAIGTVTDSITFTSANTTNGWRSIRFDNTPATNDTSRLSYCRIEYGKATGASPDDNGGGIYFSNFSKAVVANCRIDSCVANIHGGGIYCNNSDPRIYSNTISESSALTGNGGGVYLSSNNITLYNNKFFFNSVPASSVSGMGGAICCSGGGVTIRNCVISGNSASVDGGGIFAGAITTVTSNTITNNSTPGTGGGVFCSFGSHTVDKNIIASNSANRGGAIATYSYAVINNNIITNNTANFSQGNNGDGGALYVFGVQVTLSNNVISNNEVTSSSGRGGAVCCLNGANPQFTNCTISNNKAPSGGGLYCDGGSNPSFTNCILWGNTATILGPEVFLNDDPSDPAFNYCDVEGGSAAFELNGNFYTGSYLNNTNTNPLFVSPSAGSGIGFNGLSAMWSLQSNSPCINAGDPSGTYPAVDIAGNPRVVWTIDQGAYEDQTGVGVLSIHQKSLQVYPNPAINTVRINISGEALVQFYNSAGALVKTLLLFPNDLVSVNDLENGIYLVRISSSDSVHCTKLMVQK